MWLKKLFKKESTEEKSQKQAEIKNMEEDSEVAESRLMTVPEKDIDLRYSQLRILNNQKLNLPKDEIQMIESAFFQDEQFLQAKSKYSDQWTRVEVIITDKQIIFKPDFFRMSFNSIRDHNILHLSYGIIEKVESLQVKKELPKLQFTLKDSRGFFVQSVMGDKLKEMEKLVKEFGFPNGVNKFYAFKYGKISKAIDGWKIYSFTRQLSRMGVDNYLILQGQGDHTQGKLVYQVIDNSNFQLSLTYPERYIIPAGLTEKQISKCSKFRTKERLPILTYFYQYQKDSFVSLFRCSQTKGGLLTNRCPQDEKMILSIDACTQRISKKVFNDPSGKINCKIYDARGYYAAWGNKIAGKGFQSQQFYNCEVQFLDIPNIHAVRDSYNRVKGYNPNKEDFIKALGESGWIDYLFLILAGAKSMAKTMQNGKNVIVHCSDGWDRTTQLSCLSQILIDPYYRTLEGFIVLFEKDWREAGHKFRERSGQYNNVDYHPNQISPIFIQYLDCVLQIMTQFPLSFEFNTKFLNFLAEAYQSYTYGTFLTNNMKEAKSIDLEERTISVWSEVLEDKSKFLNLLYRPDGPKVLNLDVSGINFTVWRQWFLEQKSLKSRELQHYEIEVLINQRMKEQMKKNQQKIEELHIKLQQCSLEPFSN